MMGGEKAADRTRDEIEHGKRLSSGDPESAWGWGTPAGKIRAQRRAALILQGAGLAAGMRALEIGCGTGMFTEIFAASGVTIWAIDISEDLLVKARARGIPNAKFYTRRFEDCVIKGPFDAVIGSSVLHYLELEPALARIFSLLRPGGALSFAEPNMLNPQVFAERKFRSIKPLFGYVSPDETAFVRWCLFLFVA
jgi:2-polyprenyl-3-methyl-5-hydroxy-6-metoxy-1,4-benzoquinol methylase